MNHIVIATEFPDDRVSRDAGAKLRERILAATAKEPLTLDFSGTIIASISFFDEGLAKLALDGWSREVFDAKLRFKNLHRRDHEVMERLLAKRGLARR